MGRLGPAALQGRRLTFSTPLVGAGMTPGAIRTRSTTPMSPGQTINVTGVPGSGSTISGGSEYPSTFDKTTGASNPAALEFDIRGGQAATVAHGKAQQALAIFDQYVAPNSDPAGILSEEAVRKLSDVTGMNFTRLTNADAKQQITQLFLGMVGSVRDTQGNPLPRDLMDNIRKLFADPDADFCAVPQHGERPGDVAGSAEQGWQAALTAYRSRSPEAYIEYLKTEGRERGSGEAGF